MIRTRLARRLAFSVSIVACGWSPLGSAVAEPGTPMPLAAHHANYKLTLIKATGSQAPEAVDGVLSYDFTGSACDGYAMTLRQMTAVQPQEGDTRVSDMQTASFEGGDAHDYRFKIDTGGEGGTTATVDGTAKRVTDAIEVDLDKPQAEKVDLPPAVLFPTEHMKRIIATAMSGGKLLSAQVFDGSETGKKVFNTLSVVGARIDSAPSGTVADVDALKGMPRWPVTISYFDAAKSDAPPDYVLTFELYENGVSRALRLDYGDFVLAGEMTELKLLPDSKCAQ